MLPPVHLAVGYLCYAAYTRWRYDHPPTDGATVLAVFGAAIPDLLDKPLYWLDIVPVGRTLGHSLLFVLPLVVAVWLLARWSRNQTLATAFAIGILSHIATDVPWHLLSGEYHELGFLLWPITPMPPYTGTTALGIVAGVEVTTLWIEFVILAFGLVLWVSDGTPGTAVVRDRFQ